MDRETGVVGSTAIDTLVQLMHGYELVDLTHTLEIGIPIHPSQAKYYQMPWPAMDDPAEANTVILGEHTGTHVDSPSHFVVRAGDPARVHIDQLPLRALIGRARKLTFGPFEANNSLVSRAQIEEWESRHSSIASDDIVLMDMQWAPRWRLVPEGFAFLKGWPGITTDAAEYLIDRGVKAVGTDCVSLDSGDGAGGQLPAHRLLLPRGILIIENLANLPALPTVSLFVALPLKMKDGTGSPLRAVAFVPR